MFDSVDNNIGKICLSLEKYYDVRTGRIGVKSRPVLIIGYEKSYKTPQDVDYELLPISKIKNFNPDEHYDIFLDEEKIKNLGLNYLSYVRTHKTTWNHCKHMRIESPIGDLKHTYPDLFEEILLKNVDWVKSRTNFSLSEEDVEENVEEDVMEPETHFK